MIVSASGRFMARGKDEKLMALSPRPGRKRMMLVGMLLGGRWIMGLRDDGKSLLVGKSLQAMAVAQSADGTQGCEG